MGSTNKYLQQQALDQSSADAARLYEISKRQAELSEKQYAQGQAMLSNQAAAFNKLLSSDYSKKAITENEKEMDAADLIASKLAGRNSNRAASQAQENALSAARQSGMTGATAGLVAADNARQAGTDTYNNQYGTQMSNAMNNQSAIKNNDMSIQANIANAYGNNASGATNNAMSAMQGAGATAGQGSQISQQGINTAAQIQQSRQDNINKGVSTAAGIAAAGAMLLSDENTKEKK